MSEWKLKDKKWMKIGNNNCRMMKYKDYKKSQDWKNRPNNKRKRREEELPPRKSEIILNHNKSINK